MAMADTVVSLKGLGGSTSTLRSRLTPRPQCNVRAKGVNAATGRSTIVIAMLLAYFSLLSHHAAGVAAAAVAPDPVTDLQVTFLGQARATLAWVGDAERYRIEYKVAGATQWSDHYETVENETVTLMGLMAGAEYEVGVFAQNGWTDASPVYADLQTSVCTEGTYGTACANCTIFNGDCFDCGCDLSDVDRLEPSGGHLEGGTDVIIHAPTGLLQMRWCRFGRETGEQRACPETEQRLVCQSPRAPETIVAAGGGTVTVELSADRVNWQSTGLQYSYFEKPVIQHFTPETGSSHLPSSEAGQDQLIQFYGKPFYAFGDVGTTRCKFGDIIVEALVRTNRVITCQMPLQAEGTREVRAGITLNNFDYVYAEDNFTYHAPLVIQSVYPPAAPLAGGSDIIVSGEGFTAVGDANTVRCKFGENVVTGELLSDSMIKCQAPSSIFSGYYQFMVSLNAGGQYVGGGIEFQYYQIELRVVEPNSLPEDTGGQIVISGVGIDSYGIVKTTKCKFRKTLSSLTGGFWTVSSHATSTATGFEVVVGQSDQATIESSAVTVEAGYVYVVGWDLQASEDGKQMTVTASISGGGGTVLKQETVVLSATRRAGTFEYAHSGADTSVVFDVEFGDSGTYDVAAFVLNSTVVVNSNWRSANQVRCDVPPSTGTNEVMLTLNEQDFDTSNLYVSFYTQPTITAVSIPGGFIGERTSVTIFGSGFKNSDLDFATKRCRFGSSDDAETPITFFSDVAMTCLTPTVTAVGEVIVQISLNAQDYTEHEVSYVYYDKPQFFTASDDKAVVDGIKDITVTGERLDMLDRVDLARCRFQDSALACPSPTDGIVSTSPIDQAVLTIVHAASRVSTMQIYRIDTQGNQFIQLEQEAGTSNDYNTHIGTVWRVYEKVTGQLLAEYRVTNATFTLEVQNCVPAADDVVDGVVLSSSPRQFVCRVDATGVLYSQRTMYFSINGVSFHETPFTVDFYEPPVLTGTWPTGTFYDGGKYVTLLGTGFNTVNPNDHLTASCLFDGIHGRPTFKNDTHLVCITPTTVGYSDQAVVELSLYQIDILGAPADPVTVNFHEIPTITKIEPKVGLATVGTEVVISGTGLDVHGSVDGGDEVLCKFIGAGVTKVVSAVYQSSYEEVSHVICYTPEMDVDPSNYPLDADVYVSINGQDYVGTLTFTFFEDPTLNSVTPFGGPKEGGTLVVLQGAGFDSRFAGFQCRFGTDFSNIVAATYISSTEIRCLTTENVQSSLVSTVDVFLSINEQNFKAFNEQVTFTFYEEPVFTALSLIGGPTGSSGTYGGGSVVKIFGSGMSSVSDVQSIAVCRWGNVTTPVLDYGDDYLTCESGANEAGTAITVEASFNTQNYFGAERSLVFQYYENPTLSHLFPHGIPAGKASTLEVHGVGFQNLGTTARTRCLFVTEDGTETVVIANVLSDTVLICNSPVFAAGRVNVTVSLNAQDYTPVPLDLQAYDEPAIDSLFPAQGIGPHVFSDGYRVWLYGTGFANYAHKYAVGDNATCQFGAVVVESDYFNDTHMSCPWPTVDDGDQTVDVTVALNGQDYIQETGITFRYYPAPVLTGVFPSSAPLGTLTTIRLYGTGFSSEGTLETTSCRFGSLVVPAARRTDTQVDCDIPASTSQAQADVVVSISIFYWDYVTFVLDPVYFTLFAKPWVSSFTPLIGDATGGTTLVVTGTGFDASGDIRTTLCRIGDVTFAAHSATNTTVTCITPNNLDAGMQTVQLSFNNGASWTDLMTEAGVALPLFDVACASINDMNQCIKHHQCGFCSDYHDIGECGSGLSAVSSDIAQLYHLSDSSLACDSGRMFVEPLEETSYTVSWTLQEEANAYRVERLMLHGDAHRLQSFDTTAWAVGGGWDGVFPAQRASSDHPYREAWEMLVDELDPSTASFTDSSVIPGRSYRYRVSALYASWVKFKEDRNVPLLRRNVTWVPHSRSHGETADALSYRIERRESGGATYSTLEVIPAPVDTLALIQFVDDRLSPGVDYHYRIFAEVRECLQCAGGTDKTCGRGPANSTCALWSYSSRMNATGIGKVAAVSRTLPEGQRHVFYVEPPLSNLNLHISVNSTAMLKVHTSKLALAADFASSYARSRRVSSPYAISLMDEEQSCPGKVTEVWYTNGTVYQASGCDYWILSVDNIAYNEYQFEEKSFWGNRYALDATLSPNSIINTAAYTVSIFYDFVFRDFLCHEVDNECISLGLAAGQSAAYIYTDGDGATVDEGDPDAARVVRLTDSAEHGAASTMGTLFYRTKLPAAAGFETSFDFRITSPSTCTAPMQFIDYKRTHDIRATNFYVDAETGIEPPQNPTYDLEESTASVHVLTMSNGLQFQQLPVTRTHLRASSTDPSIDECETGGRGHIGGEGLAFVIHNDARGAAAHGCAGTGVGFASDEDHGCTDKITNSLAVEFDSHFNVTMKEDPHRTNSIYAGGSRVTYLYHNLLSVFDNGDNTHTDPIAQRPLMFDQHIPIDDGVQHTVRLQYVPGRLQIFMDKLRDPLLTVEVDLQAGGYLDANGDAWMGFTASTGHQVSEDHDILRWSYCSKVGCEAY